jgi:hypothetical protein
VLSLTFPLSNQLLLPLACSYGGTVLAFGHICLLENTIRSIDLMLSTGLWWVSDVIKVGDRIRLDLSI